MSAHERLTQVATRRQVMIQRFSGSQAAEAQRTLARLRVDIVARLSEEPTSFQQSRLNALIISIDELALKAFNDITVDTLDSAIDLFDQEIDFSARMIDDVTKAGTVIVSPDSAQLRAALINSTMGMTNFDATMSEALETFGKSKTIEIKRIINDGVITGDTTPQISRRVSELMQTKQRREVDTLVRTVLNHTANQARSDLYDANEDILDGYIWVSTLDVRTSHVCQARDLKEFQKGGPLPPAHWKCRSTTIPNVKSEFTLVKLSGVRSQRGSSGARTTDSKVSYGQWLKKQSTGFQDQALGPERAGLFRSGKIKIEQFVDMQGNTLSLESLKASIPSAFD